MADIEFKNVDVIYLLKKKTEVQALKDFSAVFKDKKMSVLLGYSGCGKTTVLRTITNQVHYGGSVLFNGTEIVELTAQDKNISLVQQNYSLYPHMTVFDNLAFPLKLMDYSKEEIARRVYQMAEELGISFCLTRKPKQLSGGQQQRVALGRALIKKPDVILFDEPLSNVDPEMRGGLLTLIKRVMNLYGITGVYVTHNISEALYLADRIFVMNEGKLEIELTPNQFMRSKNPVIQSLITNKEE